MGVPLSARPDLVTSRVSNDDGDVYVVVKEPVTGRIIRLREPEFWLLTAADSTKTASMLASEFAERWVSRLSADEVTGFFAQLGAHGFLTRPPTEQERARLASDESAHTLLGRLLFVKLRAFNPGRFLDRLASIYRPFHSGLGFMLFGIIAALGVIGLIANFAVFAVSPTELWTSGSILLLIPAVFVVVGLHEFAHAVVCRYYGGEVREIGFLLLYFQPCFYCDISDAWLFPRKRQRLAVTWAGPFMQFLVMAAALGVWRVTEPGVVINEFARMVVLVAWVNFLFNFNPLIKLDGYYLLVDLVDIPNLRQRAFTYLRGIYRYYIVGDDTPPPTVTPREQRVFLIYGFLAGLFSTAIIGLILWLAASLVIGAWGGVGLVLFAGLLAAMLRKRPPREDRSAMNDSAPTPPRGTRRFWRRISYGIVAVVVFVVGVAVPFPDRVSGAVTVVPLLTFDLSLNEFGLLEQSLRQRGQEPVVQTSYLQMTSSDVAALRLSPQVMDGDRVTAGDTIAILSSNQVTQELSVVAAELERLESERDLLMAPPKPEAVAEASAEVDAAQAQLDQLVQEQERISQLAERNLIAVEEREQVDSRVAVARADLANRQSALDLLIAPPRDEELDVISRQVDIQNARKAFLLDQQAAQIVSTPISGTAIVQPVNGRFMRIVAQNQVEIIVPVSDFDLPRVSSGQVVKVKVRAWPDRVFSGAVVRLPEAADSTLGPRTYAVSVVVDNADRLLRDGMSGFAKIETGRTALLPQLWRYLQSVVRVEFWSWW